MVARTKFLFNRSVWAGTALSLVAAALLVACGGGSGAASNAGATPSVASTGTITAFGSVFVNGHEYGTGSARFYDDDTGNSTTSSTGLEVGMVVDVTPKSGSTVATPEASELHIHPLVRGYVDAIDSAASTVTVMGQTVQVTSATNFSDHRACVNASTSPCTAVATLGSLTTGSYITVHGYLYAGSTGNSVTATLVSAADLPTTPPPFAFKAEGPISFSGANPVIGSLSLDFTSTTCRVAGVVKPCAGAFSAGQVVSVGSAAAPASPATSAPFAPTVARLASKLPVQTAGQTLELEGVVSSVQTSSFVVRGVTVDATGLPAGTAMPSVGDLVEVTGTVGASGQSVSATALKTIRVAATARFGLLGDASGVTVVTAGSSYTLNVLGQTVNVNAQTRLADMSVPHWDSRDPVANPFNISTFDSYLASSTSKHVAVRAEADASGKLTAISIAIVPASSVCRVSGTVATSPAVTNSAVTGTPSTFAIHGVSVSADPTSIFKPGTAAAMQTVTAGDMVTAVGACSASAVTVQATASRSATNYVMDIGVPQISMRDRMDF